MFKRGANAETDISADDHLIISSICLALEAAVARELLNRPTKGSVRKVADHLSKLGCSWPGPGLFEMSIGELLMDKARSKHGNAHHHRWNWQCWHRLPVVSAEVGIVEFVTNLHLPHAIIKRLHAR